ncbi:cupin domain-containing protein [Rasiella sp. SM2506]|uniref:cupin domain-containing protein n=1 Tax=Rasiella sp. SM2506 TaxID=3423914 RepID=UPI003D79B737
MNYRITAVPVFIFCFAFYSCKDRSNSIAETIEAHPNALHIASNEGTKWNVLGSKITGKILSKDTHGAYSVIITETPPNGGPPKHIHTHEDELFYVLQGHYEFTNGDELISAKQGDIIHLPKGKAHTFKNIDTITGITMNTITPGGFERFFADVSSLSKKKSFGKKQIDSLAKSYEIKFLKSDSNE